MLWTGTVDTLDLAVKGLIVGVMASAPMGPVGVLCVRRTLMKGRWYGFMTGLGAALSDLLYAFLTGAGMSAVLAFVEKPSTVRWMQLASTLLLFLFGLYIYRSDPRGKLRPPSPSGRGTLLSNALTGFALTISNPLIILFFLVLFARFGFVVPDRPVEQAVGYLGLVGGSVLWWWGLTGVVSKVRSHFDANGLLWLNRTIGVAVMVVSLLALYLTLRGRSFY